MGPLYVVLLSLCKVCLSLCGQTRFCDASGSRGASERARGKDKGGRPACGAPDSVGISLELCDAPSTTFKRPSASVSRCRGEARARTARSRAPKRPYGAVGSASSETRSAASNFDVSLVLSTAAALLALPSFEDAAQMGGALRAGRAAGRRVRGADIRRGTSLPSGSGELGTGADEGDAARRMCRDKVRSKRWCMLKREGS